MEKRTYQHPHHHQRQNPSSSFLNQSNRSKNTTSSQFNPTTTSAPNYFSKTHQVSERNTSRRSTTSSNGSNSAQKEDEGRDKDLSSFPTLIGTCPFMCPESEIAQRERLQDLAVFERLHGNPRKTSSTLAVKKVMTKGEVRGQELDCHYVSEANMIMVSDMTIEFCRTISTEDTRASDVRPLPVLEDTLTYLLNLLDSTDRPFEVVHDFIFDRTRSIRQDLSMQNIANDKAIRMFEKMVKFHVISHFKLRRCGSGPDISSVHYLNMEQLTKALTSLYNLYDANRDSDPIRRNEPEFRSFYVLLHLDSRSQPTGESLSLWFRHVPRPIIHAKEMRFAQSVLRCFRIGNYKRFLGKIAAEASYLQYCIIEPYINEVRALCLSCVNNAVYKLQPYPLADLSKFLIMKESDVEILCKACGLETFTDEKGVKLLPTKQTSFSCPKGGFQSYSLLGLEQFQR